MYQVELGLADLQFIDTAKPFSSQSGSSPERLLNGNYVSKQDVGESEISDEPIDEKDPFEDDDEDIKLLEIQISEVEKSSQIQAKSVVILKDSDAGCTETRVETDCQPKTAEVKNPNSTYDAIFDDSFAIGSQDMFGDNEELQVKSNDLGDEDEPMDVSGHMKMLVGELMETSMDFSDKEQEKTPKTGRKAFGDGSIKHSTPVLDSCVSNFKKRLSAITPGQINYDDHVQNPKINEPTQTDLLNESWNEELMAEFDKEFDSVASLMEVSLNISAVNDDLDKENENPHRKAPDFPVTSAIKRLDPKVDDSSPKLSDSDAAAMLAMMDDSKAFESEDLFSEFEKPQDSVPSPIRSTVIDRRILLSKNGIRQSSLDFSNEKAPVQGPESSLESDTDIFENSSEFETTSSLTSGQSSARNASSHEPMLSAIVGGKSLKVMKVFAPEFIPSDMFDARKPVGIGMKLVPPKRPSSTARCGIGARINSPKTMGRIAGEEEREHSITLYNGGNTIWVFQWKHSENQIIRNGRMHPFLNIQRKLGDLFKRLKDSGTAIVLFDAKEKFKKLLNYFGKELITEFPISSRIWDPKIAQWMWQFNEDCSNISSDKLIDIHLDAGKKQITSLGWGREIMDPFLAYNVIESLKKKLQDYKLWDHFTETEMPSMMPIMLMEINGFGLNSTELSKMKKVLQFKSALLEMQAFQSAGKQFNLSSPKDIRQILFRELGLKQPPKSSGTGKDVLSRLNHDLPKIIIEWRKIRSALQKVVIPFQQEKNLDTGRVHGFYSHFTVTGRVVMSDPSLQCVPRDFDLTMDLFTAEEIEDIKNNCKIKFGSKLSSLLKQINDGMDTSQNYCAGVSLISMRNVFVPCCDEFVILAADYSQLELRILAHLSEDRGLLSALNTKDGDVFISIASRWKKLPAEDITSSMRQEAKGIVYGVIYGMGAKTLSEQMEVDQADAARFISEFMKTYPRIKNFLNDTVKSCQQLGYIETITGRRRYLPLIHSKNPTERAQAERQAVNSKIQGSAADLVKKAMTNIHAQMCQAFPESFIPINWNRCSQANNNKNSSNSPSFKSSSISNVVYFPVLNLHDELIFEVRKSHIDEVADQIRNQMESSLTLRVRLPVVIKSGSSWGSLSVMI